MPRELFQSPALARSFTQTGGPSPTIRIEMHVEVRAAWLYNSRHAYT